MGPAPRKRDRRRASEKAGESGRRPEGRFRQLLTLNGHSATARCAARVAVLTVLDQVGISSVSRSRAVCIVSQRRGPEAQFSGARPLNAPSDQPVTETAKEIK